MSPARRNLPEHLKKYVVEQHYDHYTPEDQAVWRFIMRQLKSFLSRHAHSCYLDGLKASGIESDIIPNIDDMDSKLGEFGWGAVPVSGFIPPAAFMEFQSLGILPIASDLRSIGHLMYTPAPDIVHEAAGHAPILIDKKFAGYLKRYADVARNAIVSREDMDQYEAIRRLSDVKEHPDSTAEEISKAEMHLNEVNQRVASISEAGWLSRMNWWTAEYGLIGSLKDPRIFGAGLLSSVGESRWCLTDKVKKLPLTVDCIETAYDITEPQPQLFVTPDFETLHRVLDQLADRMAFRIGGSLGLERARQARTVNTVVLDTGLQISGVLTEFRGGPDSQVGFLRFSGPVQLSLNGQEIDGQGVDYHAQGFSTPLGQVQGLHKPLSTASDADLAGIGISVGKAAHLKFTSGIELKGQLIKTLRPQNQLLLLTFADCQVTRGSETLFDPSWGTFDLAVGENVTSVFGGPADRFNFGETADFVASRVPQRKITPAQQRRFDFFSAISAARKSFQEGGALALEKQWVNLAEQFKREFAREWLAGVGIYELGLGLGSQTALNESIRKHLMDLKDLSQVDRECIADGLRLAGEAL